MAESFDIFISYAAEDAKRVKPFVTMLEGKGWSVFWDRNIPIGKDWLTHIDQVLTEAQCVIVLWSKSSITSEWVREEANEGKGKGCLLPILLDTVKPPLGFRHLQAADFSDWAENDSHPQCAHLFDAILGILGIPITKAVVNTDQERKTKGKKLVVQTMQGSTIQGTQTFSLEPTDNKRPFKDMVLIPKGPFLYGEDKQSVTIDYDFWMDVYPVTNELYKNFIEARGYGNQQYWSENGLKWRIEHDIYQPEYWKDQKWNQPDHPVVGVSYYEAEAFASWAGKRLPNEKEWEKAARGTDGRKYPWGEEFEEYWCNSGYSEFDQTTSVTKYVGGKSPFGCYDMSGNVWEWPFKKEDSGRVVRGGSWSNDPKDLCTLKQSVMVPYFRSKTIGFRLAQDIQR